MGGGEIDHIIEAAHGSKRGGEEATAAVGMGFAGLNYRFFSNYPFAFNNFRSVKRIFDFPEAGCQLHRILALIFYSNHIPKGEVHSIILIKCAFEGGFNGNFYSSGNLLDHHLV